MSQLQEAMAAAAAGDRNTAYVMLADLLKQSPNNVDAWVALSDIVDDDKQKRTFLTRALTLDSNHAGAKEKLLFLDTPPDAGEAEPEPASEIDKEPEAVAEHLETIVEPTPLGIDETMMMPPEKVEELRMQSGIGHDDTVVDMRPVSSDAGDFEAQASGDTIPPWLMGEDGSVLDEVEAVESAMADPTAAAAEEEAQVPDWLKDEDEVVWEEESAQIVPESEPLSTREPTALKEAKVSQPAPRRQSNDRLEKMFYWLIFAFVLVGLVFVYLVWLNVDTILEFIG